MTQSHSVKHGFAPKHGKRSNIYRRWQHMIQRCHNPNDRDYPRYGAKGTVVCDRWRFGEGGQSGFICFLQDIGEPPDRTYSLDRTDVYGNYEPGNVTWATPKQQANNRRTTRMLTIRGETKPLSHWCAQYNISSKLVLFRLKKGMSDEHAVTTPVKPYRKVNPND